MMSLTAIQVVLAGVFGGLIGSFLNVVIYRVPRGESIAFPASHCPSCGTPIKFYDNIPVFGYLVLRGRCRACTSPISIQYPLIEAWMAFTAVLLFLRTPGMWDFLAAFALAALLTVSLMIDLAYMVIPNKVNLAGGIIGALFTLRWGLTGPLRGLAGAVTGVAIMGIMYFMGRIIYRREGLGIGDVKLAAVIGLFQGPVFCLITLVLSILYGGFWGVAVLAGGKLKPGREIPFAPFIALGGFTTLFFPGEVLWLLERYLNLF